MKSAASASASITSDFGFRSALTLGYQGRDGCVLACPNGDLAMKPGINIVTIGVDDLERAFSFYRALFELPDDQIGAGEDHVAFFLTEDFSFVLFPRELIAQTAGKEAVIAGTPGLVLSHRADSAAEVDAILDQVLVAGGAIITPGTESEWGYSAYFEDSEGNVWELMATPQVN